MATDQIRYDVLARDALRGVLRHVLKDAAENGLPGDHHFFITFSSTANGVTLSPRLQSQYPHEMTIILQHQFWDLVVNDEGFEVGLSFNGIPERLVVPFAAIKSFFDPSVKFGLQFEASDVDDISSEDEEQTQAEINEPATSKQEETQPVSEGGGAEVVSLDRFRKK